MSLTFGSLFAGIAGMEIGLSRAGLTCKWQVETNPICVDILNRHFPEIERHGDIRNVVQSGLAPVDLICGGDPCPKHSRARSNGESKSPDLAGYFLALVARLRPQWVLRENVPAPTVSHFDAALDALGYGTVVIRMDAASITGQSRQRDFVVGCYQATRESVRRVFSDAAYGAGTYTTSLKTGQTTPALTTHRTRYDSRDCYIWEEQNGLRILDGDERQVLAGLPEGYLAGLSEAAIARVCGNAVVPMKAQWIGERIMQSVL